MDNMSMEDWQKLINLEAEMLNEKMDKLRRYQSNTMRVFYIMLFIGFAILVASVAIGVSH